MQNKNKIDTNTSDLNPYFRFSDQFSKQGSFAMKKMNSIMSNTSSNDNLSSLYIQSEENVKSIMDKSRKDFKSLTIINKTLNPEINECLHSKSNNFRSTVKNSEETTKLNNKEKLKKLFICDDDA